MLRTGGGPLILATLLCAPFARAQEPVGRNRLHFPLSDELAGILQSADAARVAGELDRAIDLYRLALDGDGPYQIAALEEATGPRRYLGVTEWAMQGLRALPPEGVTLFRVRYDYRAGSALEEALAARDPSRALARAYERFPISSHAPRMLEAMADLALERGELEGAARALEALLREHPSDLSDPTRIRHKLLVCAIGLGRPERVRALCAELRRDDPHGQLHLASRPVSEQQLERLALERERSRARPFVDHARLDPANRACSERQARVGPVRFPVRTFALDGAGDATRGALARNLALVHGERVFVMTADQVFAYALRTGEEAPRVPRLGPAFRDVNPKVQLGGAISGETLVVPFVDDVTTEQEFRGIPIRVKVPLRKLAGFDVAGWRWLWNHGRSLDGTPLERWSFPAPPSSAEGVIFAPAFSIEGFVSSHVAAFDARTGDPLWQSWIASGQVEQTMFGEQAVEPLCTPLAVHEGVVYHSTSLGCVAALDAVTGRTRWVTEYEQLEVRPPRGFRAEPRTIEWESNAPVVQSGVAVVTPLDSAKVYGFDARTGERLWEARRGALRFVLGAGEVDGAGVVVLGGVGEARCLAVRSGALLWRTPLAGRIVSGRGVIGQGPGGPVVLAPLDGNQVIALDLASGRKVQTFAVAATGNVILAGEHVVITGEGTLAVHRNAPAPR